MEDVLEVLEKVQTYCKDQPWCGLCKFGNLGCGCILGRIADGLAKAKK